MISNSLKFGTVDLTLSVGAMRAVQQRLKGIMLPAQHAFEIEIQNLENFLAAEIERLTGDPNADLV